MRKLPKQMECRGVGVGDIRSSIIRKDQGKARQDLRRTSQQAKTEKMKINK